MAASATDFIPCQIDHLDEFIEKPALYVYPDLGEVVLGVTGLENVVEIVLNKEQLAELIDELANAEEAITREGT